MPDPVQVTISSGIQNCNFALHQNPANGPNSVIFTNNNTNTATWSMNGAASFLSDQAPPNSNDPASNSYDIAGNGGTKQLWVKDNAAVGQGVTKHYTITVGGNELACISGDPPDMQIDP